MSPRRPNSVKQTQPLTCTKSDRHEERCKYKKVGILIPSFWTGCASVCRGSLSEAVLWVADFDGAPVAGSYQADEAQQVSEGPGHVGGVVTTRKVLGAHLVKT